MVEASDVLHTLRVSSEASFMVMTPVVVLKKYLHVIGELEVVFVSRMGTSVNHN